MNSLINSLLAVGAPPNDDRRGSLIIPSAAPGSIGDDAMVMSLVTSLHDAGQGPVEVLARGGPKDWPDIAPGKLLTLPSGRMRFLKLAGAFRRVKRVFVIGADCIDGHYSIPLSLSLIGAADTAAHAGALATIVGFSYKASPKPQTIEALKSLHPAARVCGRDPRTVERIKELTGRSCELVTDTAFMLRPTEPKTPNAAADLAWIDQRRRGGRVLLGVNFNRQVIGKTPTPEQVRDLFNAYTSALTRLLNEHANLDIVFIPHDYRGEESDCDHARMLAETIARPDRVRSLTDRYRASEIKHYASLMDLILTGRMHLAIEAMGAGVPVSCVTYQDKFEGLFDHFRMDPIVIAPEQVNPDSLHAMVAGALDRRHDLKAHVAAQLERVRAMSRQNLGLTSVPAAAAG